MFSLNIIVAVDELGGFSKDGKIPWNIPEDLKYFKEKTLDSYCVMGRKTYEDLLTYRKSDDFDDVLEDRKSFVVTRNADYEAKGASVVENLRRAIEAASKDDKPLFVIGGYRLFVEALAFNPKIYLTIVKGDTYDCDLVFPIKSLERYKIVDGKETDNCYYMEYST